MEGKHDDVTHSESKEELPKENIVAPVENSDSLRNIDLNANMNETDDKKASAVANPAPAATNPAPTTANTSLSEPPHIDDSNHEEMPGWSLSEVDKMAIDSMQLAQLGTRMEEDDEDYDEEG